MIVRGVLVVVACGAVLLSSSFPKLPGTQAGEQGLQIEPAEQCAMCHGDTPSGLADPRRSWQGGMMSLASKDPVFRAAMGIANQDIPGVGEFCLRCHMPRAFFSGNVTQADGANLTPEDLDGVSCAICHRMANPRAMDAMGLASKMPPGPGNGMLVLEKSNTMRGPYADDAKVMMRSHDAKKSPFLASVVSRMSGRRFQVPSTAFPAVPVWASIQASTGLSTRFSAAIAAPGKTAITKKGSIVVMKFLIGAFILSSRWPFWYE